MSGSDRALRLLDELEAALTHMTYLRSDQTVTSVAEAGRLNLQGLRGLVERHQHVQAAQIHNPDGIELPD